MNIYNTFHKSLNFHPLYHCWVNIKVESTTTIWRIHQRASTKRLASYLWNSFHCLCHGIVGPQSLLNKNTTCMKIKNKCPCKADWLETKLIWVIQQQRGMYSWFAPDVTAAILVYTTIVKKSPLGIWLLLYKTWALFFFFCTPTCPPHRMRATQA